MKKPEIQMSLILTNDQGLDPGQISAALGLEPDRTWLKGDAIQGTSRRYACSGWKLSSGSDEHADLEVHARALMLRLSGVAEELRALSKTWDLEVSCVVEVFGASGPALHLDPELVCFFGSIDAALDIDLYWLGEKGP